MIQISLVIQWLLLMQLFEALAWRDQNCGTLNKFATNGALIANLTQPLLVCLVFLVGSEAGLVAKTAAVAICTAYICYVLYSLNRKGGYDCIKPSSSCSHLDLYWWKNTSGLFYCLTLFSLLLLLIRPFNLALLISCYFAVALALSIMFYSCGTGSMWCWFASMAPVVFAMFWNWTKGEAH